MRSNGRGNVRFGAPDRGKEPSTRSASGRTCEQDGCSTILSTYNSSALCGVHEAPEFRHALYQSSSSSGSRNKR